MKRHLLLAKLGQLKGLSIEEIKPLLTIDLMTMNYLNYKQGKKETKQMVDVKEAFVKIVANGLQLITAD